MQLKDEIGPPGLDLVQKLCERAGVKRSLREARKSGQHEQAVKIGVVLSHKLGRPGQSDQPDLGKRVGRT